MINKVFAVLLLALLATACEPSPAENTNATPSPAAQISPTPAPSPSIESGPAAQWKAGDKVKVTVDGSAVAATIVSVDEKAGTATVKVQGETKERTVKFADIAKQ